MLAPPKGIGRIRSSSGELGIRPLKSGSRCNDESENVGVPLGDRGEKKFNWGSELSISVTNRIVIGCDSLPGTSSYSRVDRIISILF